MQIRYDVLGQSWIMSFNLESKCKPEIQNFNREIPWNKYPPTKNVFMDTIKNNICFYLFNLYTGRQNIKKHSHVVGGTDLKGRVKGRACSIGFKTPQTPAGPD